MNRTEAMDSVNVRYSGPCEGMGNAISSPGELEVLTKRLHAMLSEVSEIRGVAGRTADRLFGGGDAECGHDKPCRSGQIGEMEDALESLLDELGDLRTQVERLARL